MEHLRARDTISARALEFVILTAARSSEVTGATWDEINLAEKLWTIPETRMKSGNAHRVPLSARAVDLLAELPRQGRIVFAGIRPGAPLGESTLRKVMASLGHGNFTVHGFRSSFRDWCAERTSFQREVCEMALAHAIPDAVEKAYRRGDLFDKRRKLMAAWSSYCCAPPVERGAVIPLRTA